MRKKLVKFSDERNRKYSVWTIICEDENTGKKYVLKDSVYPEGKEHLKHIVNVQESLRKYFPKVDICPAVMDQTGALKFDFIDGKSMEKLYRECVEQNRKDRMKELLKEHKKIILGSSENLCSFKTTEEFELIFGRSKWGENRQALKMTNFDATASNIIWRDGSPVFIDYEWVYDFPIPLELVVYHCVRDMYLHIVELEDFLSLKEAMEILEIDADLEMLEKSYKNFYAYVIQEKDGKSYGLCKLLNLKGEKRIISGSLEKEFMELREGLKFAEKNWKEACQANAVLSQRIQKLEKELEQEKENHRIHAKQIEDAVQEQARQSEQWRIAYEAVINTRAWRAAQKMRKLIGKK